MLRLLLQVALALGEIHVFHQGKLLCDNPLAKSSERSVKGIRGFRERFKSVWLYPVGVAVARGVQFFPGGVVARERQLYPMGGLSLRWLPYREAEGGQESREGRQENVDHHRPFGFAFTRHNRFIFVAGNEGAVRAFGGCPDGKGCFPPKGTFLPSSAGLVNQLTCLIFDRSARLV